MSQLATQSPPGIVVTEVEVTGCNSSVASAAIPTEVELLSVTITRRRHGMLVIRKSSWVGTLSGRVGEEMEEESRSEVLKVL